MIRFAPLSVEDAHALQVQDAQEATPEQLLEMHGERWSFFADDRLVAIGGAVGVTEGRCWVWVTLSKGIGSDMLPLTRYLRVFIGELGYSRVEMYVESHFSHGCRWAELLGFTNETPERPMRRFFPNGSDAYLYARLT